MKTNVQNVCSRGSRVFAVSAYLRRTFTTWLLPCCCCLYVRAYNIYTTMLLLSAHGSETHNSELKYNVLKWVICFVQTHPHKTRAHNRRTHFRVMFSVHLNVAVVPFSRFSEDTMDCTNSSRFESTSKPCFVVTVCYVFSVSLMSGEGRGGSGVSVRQRQQRTNQIVSSTDRSSNTRLTNRARSARQTRITTT